MAKDTIRGADRRTPGEQLRKLVVVTIAILLAATGVSYAAGGGKPKKPGVGVLENQTVSESASHFSSAGGDDRNAGAIASATGNIPGIGVATVDSSQSWDWGLYRGPQELVTQFDVNTGIVEDTDPMEVEEHPCALFSNTTHDFSAANSATGTPFSTDGSVVITDNLGDTLVGQTRGGSVCEIVVNTGCEIELPNIDGNDDGVCDGGETCIGPFTTTINESTSYFDIDGGASTGGFAGASGFGSIHAVFDFCIGAELALYGVSPLDPAFLFNEISLNLD